MAAFCEKRCFVCNKDLDFPVEGAKQIRSRFLKDNVFWSCSHECSRSYFFITRALSEPCLFPAIHGSENEKYLIEDIVRDPKYKDQFEYMIKDLKDREKPQ